MGTTAAIPEPALRLLDFIGRAETGRTGAAAYRTIIGHRQDELSVDITQISVDELLQLQEQWPARGWVSTAAGKYQILRGTLIALKELLSLSGSELFDAQLQESLGFALLARCGWHSVRAGKMSRRDFAVAIAKEWAAIPVLRAMRGGTAPVRRGESFYAGDGRNAATVTPAAFEDALDEALGVDPVRTFIKLLRHWSHSAFYRQAS